MKKNSLQIIKEIHLENEIEKLSKEDRDKLDSYLDDLTLFKVDELKALENLLEFAERSNELREFINGKIIEHGKRILATLGGMTLDEFKDKVIAMEKGIEKYAAIRITTKH